MRSARFFVEKTMWTRRLTSGCDTVGSPETRGCDPFRVEMFYGLFPGAALGRSPAARSLALPPALVCIPFGDAYTPAIVCVPFEDIHKRRCLTPNQFGAGDIESRRLRASMASGPRGGRRGVLRKG